MAIITNAVETCAVVTKFQNSFIVYLDLLSKIKANHVKNIANSREFVNFKKSKNEPNVIIYQPAAKLPQIPEETLNQDFLSILFSFNFIISHCESSFYFGNNSLV